MSASRRGESGKVGRWESGKGNENQSDTRPLAHSTTFPLFHFSTFPLALLLAGSARAAPDPARQPLPLALAPTTEWGASFAGEFDRRTIGLDLIYVRRVCLRMGWTPTSCLTLWGEGGVASLQLFSGSDDLQGAFGPAFGLGWTASWKRPVWRKWTPFASARATYYQSKMSHDYVVSGGVRSRRSRFEWREGLWLLGVVKPFGWGTLSVGGGFRMLFQDEFRTFRAGSSIPQKDQFVYESGMRPELILGAAFPMPSRATLWVLGEAAPDMQRVTVSVGQWGRP